MVVVRNVFPAEQAAAWNDELGDYVTPNGFYEQRDNPEPDHFFSNLKSRKPQIFGIYWSSPQVQARQSPALTATRTFLTGLWTSCGPTGAYFDSQRQCTYADRIRRREPGDTTLGLSAHMDAGSVERWRRSHHPRSEVGRSAFHAPDPATGVHRDRSEKASPTDRDATDPQGRGMGTDAAFATLGLAVGAQPIEITRAFRALSRATHPDHGGDRRCFEVVLAAFRALQCVGLVTKEPAAPPAAPTSQPAVPGTTAGRYRSFLRDLDRAAAMIVTPIPATATPANLSVRPDRASDRFAEILERELRRAASS